MHPFLVIPLAGFLGACVVGAAVVARNQPSRLRSVSALLVGCAGAASALEVIWCSPAVPTSFAPVLMRLAGLCMLAVGPLCLELVCDRWPHFERRLRIPRVIAAGSEILECCVRAGGVITGEHGVGNEKREFLHLVFSEADMDAMKRFRDCFDPDGVCNPGKIFPTTRFCVESNPKARGYDRVPLG